MDSSINHQIGRQTEPKKVVCLSSYIL